MAWHSLVLQDNVPSDGVSRTYSSDTRTQAHVQGVDDTRDVTQNGQTDVDEQVSVASSLQEDTQWRQDDGKDDLADVAVESTLASRSHITIATGHRERRVRLVV